MESIGHQANINLEQTHASGSMDSAPPPKITDKVRRAAALRLLRGHTPSPKSPLLEKSRSVTPTSQDFYEECKGLSYPDLLKKLKIIKHFMQ